MDPTVRGGTAVTHGLDEPGALRFQRREWLFERIGWVLMALFLGAALLGVCGSGPLSRTSARTGDGALVLEHDRFGRFDEPKQLVFRIAAEPSREGRVQLWIDRATVRDLRIEDIQPEPRAVAAERDRLVYDFAAAGPTEIHMDVKLRHVGVLDGRAGIVGGPSLAFRQLVYP